MITRYARLNFLLIQPDDFFLSLLFARKFNQSGVENGGGKSSVVERLVGGSLRVLLRAKGVVCFTGDSNARCRVTLNFSLCHSSVPCKVLLVECARSSCLEILLLLLINVFALQV